MQSKDKHKFWDNKIIKWEQARYDFPESSNKLFDIGKTLRARRDLALTLLLPFVKNKVVIEVGCGSAQLITPLLEMGIKQYIGLDFSSEAIKFARNKYSEVDNEKISFLEMDVNKIEKLEADICLSLGLLDWLTLDEVTSFTATISSKYFIHSFSKKQLSFGQICHKLFIYLQYGHKNRDYSPIYYSSNQIKKMLRRNSEEKIFIEKKSGMSFGRIVHNFPVEKQIEQ